MEVFSNLFGGQAGGGQSPIFMIGWIVIMIAVFYFLLIRPQQKREKERRGMISGVKSGDRIVFGGGFMGTVANVKEKTLMVKIADGVKVEILRAAIVQVLGKDEEPDSAKLAEGSKA